MAENGLTRLETCEEEQETCVAMSIIRGILSRVLHIVVTKLIHAGHVGR